MQTQAVNIWSLLLILIKLIMASFSTGAEMSWCRTVFFNGCRTVLVPTCLVSFLHYSQRHTFVAWKITVIEVSLFLVILIHLLVCLIYLLILICLLGDSMYHSKCKRNFEDIYNRAKDISKSPRWAIRLSQWFIYFPFVLLVIVLVILTFLHRWKEE